MFCTVLLLSVQLLAQTQPDITGLWRGTMYNDTTQRFLKYEIAISEKNGKLIGYTHTYFILDDKEYHGVKKTKIKIRGEKIIIEDIGLIANNYPISPAKGVHQLDVLTLEIKEDNMTLTGSFSTNQTKLYRSLTGNIIVKRKTNFSQSALLPHLQELGLIDELSFIKEEKMKRTIAIPILEPVFKEQQITNTAEIKSIPEVKKQTVIQPISKLQERVVVKNNTTIKQAQEVVKVVTIEKTLPGTKTIITQPEPIKVNVAIKSAIDIENRAIETIQSVNYITDSLVLTLFDNGEIDGDTVSVLMNGAVIMPMVGLSTNAIKKTIYTKDIKDSIKIVMYAETLGIFPPNTGLLIVNDGTDRYEIRFSGDLKKNAAIVFRKKNN